MPVKAPEILRYISPVLCSLGVLLVFFGCILSTGFRFWWHLIVQNLKPKSKAEDRSTPLFFIRPARGRRLMRAGIYIFALGFLMAVAQSVIN